MRFPKHLQDIHVDADDLAAMALMLNAANIRMSDGKPFRADANETALFARQLEYVRARTYDKVYAENKAMKFIPISTDVPSGADSFVMRQWDWAGMAKIISNFADDLPTVTVIGKERTKPCKSLGTSYNYSIQEVRSAAFAGVPLDMKKTEAARRAMENAIDVIAAVGDTDADLEGFANNANVPLATPTNGDWDGVSTTGQQIVEDLNGLLESVVTTSKETFTANRVILSSDLYAIAKTKPYSQYDARSCLEVFIAQNPGVQVDRWLKLNTADAQGDGPRAIAYAYDPLVVEFVISQPFEQMAPQQRNLAIVVPCHQRIGGVSVNYPIGMAYMDGLLD